MRNYITLGYWNKNYKYIILSIFIDLLKDIISGVNYEGIFKTIQLFGERELNFSLHNYIHQIFSYFGIFIFSLIITKIESSTSETLMNENISSVDQNSKSNKSNKSIKLIYIKDEKERTGFNYKNLFFSVIITLFILVIAEQFLSLYGVILKDLDFWMFEIIILSMIIQKMFNLKIYKHQKLGLFLNMLSFIFKICSIITSLKDKSEEEKPIIYVKYNIFLLSFIGLIIYLFSITLRSYANSKLKWFLDLRYLLSSKLLVIYGLIGIIVCSIISLVSTFIKCKNIDNKIEFNDYICSLTNNVYTKDNYTELYFENFKLYLEKFSYKDIKEISFEIFLTILNMIISFLDKYFYILLIKYLSPVYIIFANPLYFMNQKLMLGLYTLLMERTFFLIKNTYSIQKFYFDISGDLLSIFGFLIYLEIIELNCCDLNYNLKKNIIIRSYGDLSQLENRGGTVSSLYSEENEENKEKEENMIRLSDL